VPKRSLGTRTKITNSDPRRSLRCDLGCRVAPRLGLQVGSNAEILEAQGAGTDNIVFWNRSDALAILASEEAETQSRLINLEKRRSMPVVNDEMILSVDGLVGVDPGLSLRNRAQAFVTSRKWSTSSVFYGDQREPDQSIYGDDTPVDLSVDGDSPDIDGLPSWSMCFCLGLDHVRTTHADWFADVKALVEFARNIAIEACCQFIVEFRLNSRSWYSETLCIVDENRSRRIDFAAIRSMLERFTEPGPSRDTAARED
jgi:hypothetical protein